MENFTGYLPIDRRFAIARGESLPTHTSGTALIAKISGFDQSLETQLGKPGNRHQVDDLSQCLDQVYDSLIQIIHAHHGSVIFFMGDLLVCWFDGDNGLRTIAAGLEMDRRISRFQKSFRQKEDSCEMFVPALTMAAAAGPASRWQVGDPSLQLIDLLAGKVVEEAETLLACTESGQFAVTEEIAAALGSWLQVSPHSSGGKLIQGLHRDEPFSPWPTLNGRIKQAELRPWLIPALYVNLLTSREQLPLEVKKIPIMAFSFEGIDCERGKQSGKRLDQLVRWLQNTLNRYNGLILPGILGRRGGYFFAVFGSSQVQMEDIGQAMDAALALLERPDFLSFIKNVRIGISCQAGRTGSYGSQARRTFGVASQGLDMARWLMEQAQPEQILVASDSLDAPLLKKRLVWIEAGRRMLGSNGSARTIDTAAVIGVSPRIEDEEVLLMSVGD